MEAIVSSKTTDDYPANWPDIAREIKQAAGWRCEHCGHAHHVESGHVLTVHHLDMVKSNCDQTNLVALCQRCHLRIQSQYKPGQAWLFAAPPWAVSRGLA
jgi:5-methylcytosine-specific restriction endonuclease McrA